MPPCSSSDLIRRGLPRVFLCVITLAATITPSLPFQQKSALNPGDPSTIEDFKAGDANREPYQNATELLAALQVSHGDWVADVGAGAGYYSMRLADLAGPEGKVFSEDISTRAMGWLNARVKLFNLRNVEVIKGEIDDPKLPADRLAAVLIVDSYHHFTNHQAMLEKIFQALKPGGRLVITDYSFREHRTQPREDQLKLHEIDPDLVRTEAGRSGFEIVKRQDPFVKWKPGVGNSRASATDMWLMVAVRPK
jgi:predicted methyltransferase